MTMNTPQDKAINTVKLRPVRRGTFLTASDLIESANEPLLSRSHLSTPAAIRISPASHSVPAVKKIET